MRLKVNLGSKRTRTRETRTDIFIAISMHGRYSRIGGCHSLLPVWKRARELLQPRPLCKQAESTFATSVRRLTLTSQQPLPCRSAVFRPSLVPFRCVFFVLCAVRVVRLLFSSLRPLTLVHPT